MIARLSGILIQKSITQCVVDVHGTGYRVLVPLSTLYELPDEGQSVVLQIYTQVREDAITLYGFFTKAERDIFELMISVNGIGPKLAVNILSGITAVEWLRAIATEDLKRLTGIPGVGRKTAERMVLELRDKAGKFGHEVTPSETSVLRRDDQLKDDAVSALVNLGYRGSSVKEAIEKVIQEADEVPSLDELLKKALRILAG